MIPRPFVRCTFAGSHETHENGPLRPRQLPVGSSPVSDGWRLCGALWRGWRIESPLDIRGGGGLASERPRVRPLPASGGSVRSRWCFFAASPADGLPSLPRFRPCRVDLAGVGVAVLTASVPAASGRPAEKRSGAPRQECAACRFVRCGRWLGNCRKDCVLEVFTPLHVLGVAVLKSRVYGFPNCTGYLTDPAYR